MVLTKTTVGAAEMADDDLSHRVKRCIRCERDLSVSPEFFYRHKQMADGFLNVCKACFRKQCSDRHWRNREGILAKRREKYAAGDKVKILAAQKSYYERNKKIVLERRKEYVERNRDVVKERQARFRERNRERLRHENRGYQALLKAEGRQYDWRRANPERARERHREYCKEWLRSGKRRACHAVAVLMGRALRGSKDGYSWESLVGYTRLDLVRHLERQFVNGMSWDNYGDWHIDHILPVAMFEFESSDDDAFKACWALTNLRPLWGIANMSKGGRRLHLI
jgi:hypothetical protein